MASKKIRISEDMIKFIKEMRKEHNISAYELSKLCGRKQSWIPNIENHRTTSMTAEAASKLGDIFQELDEKKEFESYIERQLELQNDPDYLAYQESEYAISRYGYKDHQKELKRQLGHVHKNMNKLCEKIDNRDSKSVEKYEAYIKTYISLVTSKNGQEVFHQLFKYPLQFLDQSTLDKIVSILENDLPVKYVVEEDYQTEQFYMRPKAEGDDLFI